MSGSEPKSKISLLVGPTFTGRPCRVLGPQLASGFSGYRGTPFTRAWLRAPAAREKSAWMLGSLASSRPAAPQTQQAL
eukprot:scaffold488720_cov45-Prasinocladus_malaysianus.AAC.1